MIEVEAAMVGTCVQITCTGVYGVGSEGNPSGHLVKDAIKRFMDREGSRPSEVLIDFTRVEYVWGDGPAWSVIPWARHLKVTYLVNDRNEQALRDLFSDSNLDKVLKITIRRVSDA